MSRKLVELEDIENALYALRKARNPMIPFSSNWEEMKDQAIAAMQQGMDQATQCLQRICDEVNHGS